MKKAFLTALSVLAIVAPFEAPAQTGEDKLHCSLNGFFCAASEREREVTTVYRRRAGGVKEPLWSMKGYFPVAFVSNDGEYLIAGYFAGGVLPPDYKRSQVMISFYDRGRLIHEVRLDELVRDFSKMPKVDSQYRWGGYLGLNADDYLTVQLFDQSWVLFNARTGRAVR